MTPSELRQARCMAAIEDAVGFLDRKADARRAAAMLIQQFQSPGAILEADLAALAPEAVGPDAAELLGFVPSLARKVWHEGGGRKGIRRSARWRRLRRISCRCSSACRSNSFFCSASIRAAG